MQRTIEVVKARNQAHVWGPQLLKIYAKGPDRLAIDDAAVEVDRHKRLIEARRRHPYRSEGGIFIYPSIHYYLSVYKRQIPSTVPKEPETPLPELNATINGGFPSGRCTAFIGVRGGHKSHLGYYHLLWRVLVKGEKALVVSLRDDEGMARKTMSKILRQQFSESRELRDHLPTDAQLEPYRPDPALRAEELSREDLVIRKLEIDGDLEVLYYPPGYISPEEFFHRMFISIRQFKQPRNGRAAPKHITVLFNSLDQLSARFPLCAKESIFVPGLIDMLTAESITSIFVAVTEPGQPPEQYGLLPMADLILSFSHRRFPRSNWERLYETKTRTPQSKHPDSREDPKVQVVVLGVVRVPAGQAAGARGILELINEGDPRPNVSSGLHFKSIDEDFGEGEPPVPDEVKR
jgi:hypothetical protein